MPALGRQSRRPLHIKASVVVYYYTATEIMRCRAGHSALPPACHRTPGGGAQGPSLQVRTTVAE